MANIKKQEVEEKTEFVYRCQTEGMLKGEIKRAFRGKYGEETSHVTIERYISRAEELRKKLAGLVDQEHERQKWVEHLQTEYIQNPKARPYEKLKAIEQIIKLQGLNAPEKHEHTATVVHERKPIVIDWDEFRRLRYEVFGTAKVDGPGQSVHDAGPDRPPAALPGTDRH
jgi:hypothetical protein